MENIVIRGVHGFIASILFIGPVLQYAGVMSFAKWCNMLCMGSMVGLGDMPVSKSPCTVIGVTLM